VKKISGVLSQILFSSKRSYFLWAMIALAFLIRLVFIVYAGDVHHPVMYEHGVIAHNLYTGHGFAMHWPYPSLDPVRAAIQNQPPLFEGAFLPPLNPYLIYGSYVIFGENATAIGFLMIFYAVISSFIPLAVFKTGMLIGSEKAARLSTLISVLFLPAAFAVVTFSGSPLYQLLGIIIVYYTIRTAMHPTFRSFILLGIYSGVMTMLRSEFFFLGFILIALSIFFGWKKMQSKQVVIQGLVSIVLCAMVIAPWTFRNYRLFHEFVPVLSHPWYEIWRGNNIHATGSNYNAAGDGIWINGSVYPEVVKRMDAIPYDQFFEPKVDPVFKDEVFQFVKDNPGRFIVLSATKAAGFFTIDFYHPSAFEPLYFIPMIAISLLTVTGIYSLYHSEGMTPAPIIFSVFFLCYLGLTIMTVMLPRYQIYVFCAGLPLTGVGIFHNKRQQNFWPE
jgi:hypothetical protein